MGDSTTISTLATLVLCSELHLSQTVSVQSFIHSVCVFVCVCVCVCFETLIHVFVTANKILNLKKSLHSSY